MKKCSKHAHLRIHSIMQTDTLSDTLTRIRNGNILFKKKVEIPFTRLNHQLCCIFEREGFIDHVQRLESDHSKLMISLKYHSKTKKPCITNLKRISKPGLRLYANAKEIPTVLGGMGILVLSTSQGILTDHEARQLRIGGELLCSIW